jgi:hypothetical protein
MEHSKEEIAFAQYGRELSGIVLNALNEIATQSGFAWFSVGSDLEGKTWFDYAMSQHGKVETISAKFKATENAIEDTIQVTLGHDSEWKPIVAVLSSKTEPVSIKVSGIAQNDALLVETEAQKCFRLIVGW